MTNPESTSARSSLLAVGREVEPAFVEQFAVMMRRILPPETDLDLRERPGIVYCPAYDLFPRLSKVKTPRKEAWLQNHVSSLLESLDDEDELDLRTATSGLTLSLHRPEEVIVRTRRSSYLTVGVRIDDTPIEYGANEDMIDDYIVERERRVFAELAGQSGNETSWLESRHSANIGIIRGDISSIEPEALHAIGQDLPGSVPVSGIGVLKWTRFS
jgi:hypothetical protein